MKKIGTVEILKLRVYPLDAASHDESRSTVIVEPGVFDLYRVGDTTFWLMHGQMNLGPGSERLGDGLFLLHTGDEASDIEVSFPSPRFGPDEWADLLAEPTFTEGHDEQRIRVTLLDELAVTS